MARIDIDEILRESKAEQTRSQEFDKQRVPEDYPFQKQAQRVGSNLLQRAQKVTDYLRNSSLYVRGTIDTLEMSWKYAIKPTLQVMNAPSKYVIKPIHDRVFRRAAFGLDENGERNEYNRLRFAAAAAGVSLPALALSAATFYGLSMGALSAGKFAGNYAYDVFRMAIWMEEKNLLVARPQNIGTADSRLYETSICELPCTVDSTKSTYHIVDNHKIMLEAYWDNIKDFNFDGFVGIGELHLRTADEIADEAQDTQNLCTAWVLSSRNDNTDRVPKIVDMRCVPAGSGSQFTNQQSFNSGPARSFE
jgi:hypothetical protein